MATRCGIKNAEKIRTKTSGLLANKVIPVQPTASVAVDKSAASSDFEVHEETEAVLNTVVNESPKILGSGQTVPRVLPDQPSREGDLPAAVTAQASDTFSPLTKVEERLLPVEHEHQSAIPEKITRDGLQRSAQVTLSNPIEQMVQKPSSFLPLNPEAQKFDDPIIEIDASIFTQKRSEIMADKPDMDDAENIPRQTAQTDAVTSVELREMPSVMPDPEKIHQPTEQLQIKSAAGANKKAVIDATSITVNQETPALGQSIQNKADSLKSASVTQVMQQPVAQKRPPPVNNGIDIKIGKIELDVHLSAPVTSPPPIIQQTIAKPQANNLSRYYLKGF
jgi:hypothetical protein